LIISATTTITLVTLKPPPTLIGRMPMLLACLTLYINKRSRDSITAASIITRPISWVIISNLGPVIIERTPVIIARALVITSIATVITVIAIVIRVAVITTVAVIIATVIILAGTICWRAVSAATY
jgi:hypothetical protein